jgi:DNA-binding response OmpR family regulator
LNKGRSKGILLVDDEQDNNKIFTIALHDNGFEADAFEDPQTSIVCI